MVVLAPELLMTQGTRAGTLTAILGVELLH